MDLPRSHVAGDMAEQAVINFQTFARKWLRNNQLSEAEEYVRNLHSSRQGPDDDLNRNSLKKALKLFATELYSRLAHFLLELIQNADDADFPEGVKPTLSLVFRGDGWVWVGCNQAPFTKANVEALCDINGSTKKVTNHQKGYIGEKGIGFKSVFKASDRVWVSSFPFNFRLDKTGLGMISPEWENIPETFMMDEPTMFCLRIPDNDSLLKVKEEMMMLKPELLLFLRKLREINVVIAEDENNITDKFSIYRADIPGDTGHGYTTTQLTRTDVMPIQKSTSDQFVVFRQTTSTMPAEVKRIGIEQSEIVIAFPLGDGSLSWPTFNFLPIRDYGFPFLLQADFITTVNREDIEIDNRWNQTLRQNAADMFLQCINIFNGVDTASMKILRYRWPRYTKSPHNASGTIMENFIPHLHARMKEEPVIQSRAGSFAAAKSLTILPEHWTDGKSPSTPLFAEPSHLQQYTSAEYELSDLQSLGVVTKVGQYFCGFLKDLPLTDLQQKDKEWHNRLARAALVAPAPLNLLKTIKLIPLRDGRWVTAATLKDPIHFPDTDNNVDIPDGIELSVVETSAIEDGSRKNLFAKLGVKALDPSQVCELILKKHRGLSSTGSDLSIATLVAHARHLYRFLTDAKCLSDIKFAVAGNSNVAAGTDLYMDSITPGAFLMSQHFGQNETCQFLHPSYLEDVPEPHSTSGVPWHIWLRVQCKISTKPKLVSQPQAVSNLAKQHPSAGQKATMHPHFRHLLNHVNSAIWLTLLRDQWSFYVHDIKLLPENDLKQALVTCKDGTRKPLSKVYLATTNVLSERLALSHVDLIRIDDTEHKSWADIETHLGLRRKQDLNFFMSILHEVAQDDKGITFSDVVRLMHGIQHHSQNHEHIIRKFFEGKKLVAVVNDNSLSWLSTKECLWKAPECLSGYIALAQHYQTVQPLFTNILEIYNATASDIAKQIVHDAGSLEKIEGIKALLVALSDYMTTTADDTLDYDLLRRLPIFPVRRPDGVLILVAADDKSWFIPDNARHRMFFQDQLPFMDFANQEVPRLLPLLQVLGIAQKCLSSTVVEEMVIPQGASRVLPELTAELQYKAGYVSLLVPAQKMNEVKSAMSSLMVYASKRMLLRRYVLIGSTRIYGTDDAGKAVLQEHETPLQLHCRDKAIRNNHTPYAFICESIIKVFNIPEEHHGTLNAVLYSPAGSQIEVFLSSKGLWHWPVQDIDDEDEEEEPEEDPEEHEVHVDANNENEDTMSDGDAQSDDGLFVGTDPDKSYREHPNTEMPATSREFHDASGSSQVSSTDIQPALPPDAVPEAAMPQPKAKQPQAAQLKAAQLKATSAKAAQNKKTSAKASHGPSPETQAANKAKRKQAAIDVIDKAATYHDLDQVPVFWAPDNMGNLPPPFTGLAFGASKPSKAAADQKNGIQYKGELFIRGILSTFGCSSDDAWTSLTRIIHGLEKHESLNHHDCFSFTVLDLGVINTITQWLEGKGCIFPQSHDLTNRTCHILVKATEGSFDQPFTISNREFELANKWSSSQTDIALVFRVSNLNCKPFAPQFFVVVDPVKLMLGGKASMTALGGGFSMDVGFEDDSSGQDDVQMEDAPQADEEAPPVDEGFQDQDDNEL